MITQLRVLGWLAIVGAIAVPGERAYAQITPDNTLGAERSVVTPDVIQGKPSDRINGGARRGANLFHSFRDFNVREGRGAYFSNPNGVENIFGRVTGGSRSEIGGTLGVSGEANLFLINPNGILFGSNASLDVKGSFVGTTADGIGFGDRGFFNATNPNAPSQLLTVNPAAFLFNQIAAQPIINRSVSPNSQNPEIPDGLRVPTQESLLLVGGEVRLEGGSLRAPGGRIELGGLAAPGTVGLNIDGSDLSLSFPDSVALADVFLVEFADTIPEIDVTAGDGGDIAIFARNINVLDGSDICAGIGADGACNGLAPSSGYVGAQAGDITLDAQGTITIADPFSVVDNDVNPGAVGNGGNVNIKARLIKIADGGQISASTFGEGDAGSINIFARDTVSLDDGSSDTFIFSNVGSDAVGNSGGINITTGSLFVKNGAQIQSEVEGEGNAGKIIIDAGDIVSFDGRDANDFPSAVSSRVGEGATGSTGGIKITTDSLLMTNRAQLLSDTRGQGDAGNISIEAQNQVYLMDSDIISEVGEEGGVGKGGNINIKTGTLLVQNGSSLLADTENVGDAGNITIEARDRVVVEGEGISAFANSTDVFPSQITATVDFNGFSAVGEGGDITISTGSLLVADEGFINTSTEGLGNAGNINITAADSISVTTEGFIASRTFDRAIGDGGDITINANSLSLTSDAQIITSTFSTGKAGNITIALGDRLTIDGSGSGLFAITQDTSIAPEASSDAGQSLSTAQNLTSQTGQLVTGITGTLSSDNDVDLYRVYLPGNQTFSATTVDNSNADTRLFLFKANGQGVYFNDDVDSDTYQSTLPDGHPLTPQTAGNYYLAITSYANDPVSEDGIIFGSGSFTDVLGPTGTGGSQPLSGWSNDGDDSGSYFISITDSSTTPAVISGGTGGNINISTESLSISNGAEISAESRGQGGAGNITINAEGTLSATDGDIITAAERASGGAINVTTQDIRLQGDSDIRTEVASGTGGGGNIILTADSILAFDDSDILAFAQDGQGGNITLNTPVFFGSRFQPAPQGTNPNLLDGNDRVDINASGAFSGVISLPDVSFLQNSLTELPVNAITTETLIANSCVVPSGGQRGTFIITGAGGLPVRPGDASVSPYSTGTVRTVPDNESSLPGATRPWQKGDPIVEPTGTYRLANGKLIMSRECSQR